MQVPTKMLFYRYDYWIPQRKYIDTIDQNEQNHINNIL